MATDKLKAKKQKSMFEDEYSETDEDGIETVLCSCRCK